jgi:hypothetical protein
VVSVLSHSPAKLKIFRSRNLTQANPNTLGNDLKRKGFRPYGGGAEA